MESKQNKIYLAGPYGFSEIGQTGISIIMKLISKYFQIIDPFEQSKLMGEKIFHLQQKLNNNRGMINYNQIREKLIELNQKIGLINAKSINSVDFVIAILDGTDIDSGTAAEIGYAYGLGKKIYGYRGDFRNCGDNFGSQINIQVEYFIIASGGKIFFSLNDLNDYLIKNF